VDCDKKLLAIEQSSGRIIE